MKRLKEAGIVAGDFFAALIILTIVGPFILVGLAANLIYQFLGDCWAALTKAKSANKESDAYGDLSDNIWREK